MCTSKILILNTRFRSFYRMMFWDNGIYYFLNNGLRGQISVDHIIHHIMHNIMHLIMHHIMHLIMHHIMHHIMHLIMHHIMHHIMHLIMHPCSKFNSAQAKGGGGDFCDSKPALNFQNPEITHSGRKVTTGKERKINMMQISADTDVGPHSCV